MAKKPVLRGDEQEVVYSPEHWRLLHSLRERAIQIMRALESRGIPSIVHGSVARGDVTSQSDVDIVVPIVVPTFRVEAVIEELGLPIISKKIVQATPFHVLKAHIELEENTVVTIPLVPLTSREREFYKFGGEVALKDLENGRRVPGVDKRLMLIVPTPQGHKERPIIGAEEEAARVVGVSLDIVKERVRVLVRRDTIGRTGVYLKEEIPLDESFENALRKIADRDPAVRRLMMSRGCYP